MNSSLLSMEIAVTLLGVGVLLGDLWMPAHRRRWLGWGAATGLLILLGFSLRLPLDPVHAFGATGTAALEGGATSGMYVRDALSLFFQPYFLVAGILVLLMTVEQADRLQPVSEFFSLTLFALVGMLLCASTNDFILMFASLELMTITFVILTSYQRNRQASLEAGIKYLIIGAVASAFMVFGIALVFGSANTTQFDRIAQDHAELMKLPVFRAGILLILVGLGFKLAAFPFQIWAPDVYQGAPTPSVAFLAVGSKAAGLVLLMRVLMEVVPDLASEWSRLLVGLAAITILYGSLCAIPQRSLKRLMGYSSISNAGVLLLGVAALSRVGASSILFYIVGYLFAVMAAFLVVSVVLRHLESDDIAALSGLGERAPFLAGALTCSMVSLAGVPPLAGFVGKFLLIRSVAENAGTDPWYYGLVAVAILGALLSVYYYFGVIRAVYWGQRRSDPSPIPAPWPVRLSLGVCIVGMVWLGVYPSSVLKRTTPAVERLNPSGLVVDVSR